MNDVFGKVLITSKPVENRKEIIAELQNKLKSRVKQAWIFGSLASGVFSKNSDIDIFLVMETTEPFLSRALQFSDLTDLGYEIDILVYTPEEFQKLTTDPAAGFWKTASSEMVQIL